MALSANVATPDHNVPTSKKERDQGIAGIEDDTSRIQVQTLDDNCKAFNIVEFGINDIRQGIVHVVGPEQGLTLPGMTVVCGDSHTATHGAFGCLAHGIGTSEVEHVLATQCLVQKKSKNMLVRVDGVLGKGVTPKMSCWPLSVKSVLQAVRVMQLSSVAKFSVICRLKDV